MGDHRRFAAFAVAGFAALTAGCGDSGTGPVRLDVAVFASPASIPVNGTTTIIAQVTTDRAQPATNVALEWSSSFGFLMVGGPGGGAGPTDSGGRAVATLRGEGVAGLAVVTAKVVGREAQGQVEVRIGPD